MKERLRIKNVILIYFYKISEYLNRLTAIICAAAASDSFSICPFLKFLCSNRDLMVVLAVGLISGVDTRGINYA